MTGRSLVMLALAVAAISCSPAQPRWVVLISVDTLRADKLGAYGSKEKLTPHLDGLAARSEVFTAFAPAPFTLPSISSLLSGRYPEELGVLSNEHRLPGDVPTLASELKAAGWMTGAVVSNFVLREAAGLRPGFDRYDDDFPDVEKVRRLPERTATDTTDAAIAMLSELDEGANAVFLWVRYQDPHGPYTPPARLREMSLETERDRSDGQLRLSPSEDHRGLGGIPDYQMLGDERDVAFYRAGYAGEIRWVDQEIGRLLDHLAEASSRIDVATVFAADHGESLGEGDLWFAHGERLSDPLVRVPLFLDLPGRPEGRRQDLASLLDIYPTLLAHVGIASEPTPGRDLLAEGAPAESSTVYLSTLVGALEPAIGLVSWPFKLVLTQRDERWVPQLTRLFWPEVDLSETDPQTLRELRVKLAARHDAIERRAPVLQPDLGPEVQEQLRALGYVSEDE